MEVMNAHMSEKTLNLEIICKPVRNKEFISPVYKIHFDEIQLRIVCMDSQYENKRYIYLKYYKCNKDGVLHTLKVNCPDLGINSKTFISDDTDWRLLSHNWTAICKLTIELTVDVYTSPFFRSLLDDDSLTDFEIKGIDGSIRVHKVVFAAAGEVFKKMISLDLKEKKDAQVEFPYLKCVLQNLKDYLYLNTINNNNVEDLLLLANCYMLSDLKEKCIYQLVLNFTTEEAIELIEFAVINKITELLVEILKAIQERNSINFDNYTIKLPSGICDEDENTKENSDTA